MPDLCERSAIISTCQSYRYRLERKVGDGPTVMGIMINPSWADARQDDRTIRRWIGFGQLLGWGKILIGNKFAYRSQYPSDLRNSADPIGPENDRYLREMLDESDVCIVAWGPISKVPIPNFRRRWEAVQLLALEANKPLYCWGTVKDGQPKHPLMIPYSTPLRPWTAPQNP